MNKIIILIVILCLLGCNDKKTTESPVINNSTTEKFDIKKFNANQMDSLYQYIRNDTIIKLHEKKESYQKELIIDNSFIHTFVYDKTTQLLIKESCTFLGMPIGVWITYDENGTLLNWKNYDEGFVFTVNDLLVMLKKDLQIDLINDEYYRSLVISRHFDKKFYFMNIYYYLIEISDAGGTRTIKIDGETGKILTDKSSFIEE